MNVGVKIFVLQHMFFFNEFNGESKINYEVLEKSKKKTTNRKLQATA
jgi:hypothetical protein